MMDFKKAKFDPYAKDIIFLDTEFSSLDPYKGEILSIGLVKLNGEEFYIELKHEGEVSAWVKKNVMHHLTDKKYSRQQAIRMIKKFVGKTEPFVIAYVNQYDTIYMHKLFGTPNKWPFYWLPIDFASILFAMGIDPEIMVSHPKTFYSQLEIDYDSFRKHHALDDAKLYREIYLNMMKK